MRGRLGNSMGGWLRQDAAETDCGETPQLLSEVALVEVEGRMFPVEEEYLEAEEDEELAQQVARAVEGIARREAKGDVLVFLPGEREIRECAEVLEGRGLAGTEVLPLFARLGLQDQQRIFRPPKSGRRVVLATNVAETSLTIPGIVYVVDPGLARISRWSPARGVQRLHVEPVSRASLRQRMGRCGRVRPGVCVRLFGEDEVEERPEFTDPEIRRSSLAGVILRMKLLGLPELDHFPLLDPPSPKLVSEGYRTLREIGALDGERRLTDVGKDLARLPIDPRLARMLMQAQREDCLAEMLVIVAGLEVSDVRERPAEKTAEADKAQAVWLDSDSDFRGLLRLWLDLMSMRDRRRWRMGPLRKFCRKKFLNWRRVIEWGNLRDELEEVVRRECRWKVRRLAAKLDDTADYEKVHRSLLAGVPRQLALVDRAEKVYRSAGGISFAIFPGSGLFGLKRPEWVLGFELVETTRLWARRVAKIDPAWVEQVAPQLCKSRYGEVQWHRKQGVVVAKETVTCGGLAVVAGRQVHYGRIHPERARQVFVREALVGGRLGGRWRFLERLAEVRDEVLAAEHKLRRRGGLWDERMADDFFAKRVPENICTAKAFRRWGSRHEDEIIISLEDMVPEGLGEFGLAGFPDHLEHGGEQYTLYYHYGPGERDDGLTVGLHIDQLASIPAWLPGWGVPGMLAERVERLVRGMPKALRVACQPVAEAVDGFVEECRDLVPDGPLEKKLATYLTERTGMRIDAGLLDPRKLGEPWLVNVWVCDDEGEEIAFGGDLEEIRRRLDQRLDERAEAAADEEWECAGMRSWECGELPRRVETASGAAFPALVDEGESVGVKSFANEVLAAEAHRGGCVRLLALERPDQVKWLVKHPSIGMTAKVELPRLGRGRVHDRGPGDDGGGGRLGSRIAAERGRVAGGCGVGAAGVARRGGEGWPGARRGGGVAAGGPRVDRAGAGRAAPGGGGGGPGRAARVAAAAAVCVAGGVWAAGRLREVFPGDPVAVGAARWDSDRAGPGEDAAGAPLVGALAEAVDGVAG
jgi:ATP-dependent helicase HrpA